MAPKEIAVALFGQKRLTQPPGKEKFQALACRQLPSPNIDATHLS